MANENQKLKITPEQLATISNMVVQGVVEPEKYFHNATPVESVDLENCTPNGLHVTINYWHKLDPKTFSVNSDGACVYVRG